MGFLRIGVLAQPAAMGNVVLAQMPTADATLLPPPYAYDALDERADESCRHLEDIGVEKVLGTMIEQKRRASQPAFPAYVAPQEQPHRAPAISDVFLKAR